ncbi:MAG: monovalent cation:proton antiporter-2 (CPA2) family protein [Acidiferrobacterales bacterium]
MYPFAFQHILILLGVAVVLVAAFRYLHLPQVLAYLCAGFVVGPYGLAWIPDLEGTRYLAEFGLVFLMFTIGLEFSLPQLLAMKRAVLGLGGAQVLFSFTLIGGSVWLLGVPAEGAIVIGGVLSLSSTAISMKQLVEQLEQHSRHGRAALGVLLFQDLAVVPFLIVIPMFAGGGTHSVLITLAWAFLKSAAVLVAILLVGRVFLRPVFHEVALARSREFFMLTVLLITLASAWLTQLAGLSLALGAFLAGLMIGETEYRHQVESDILPFRDVLLGLFFVTVGMLLNLAAIRPLWPWILAGLTTMLALKIGLITILGMAFGLERGVALRTGLVLAESGEFGFAMLIQAHSVHLLPNRAIQIVLATMVLSMLFAPVIIRFNGRLATRLMPSYRERRSSNIDSIRAASGDFRDHVIICGYGRSGQNLAWMLRQEGVRSLSLDLDPVRVRDARDAGEEVIYGDGTRSDMLQAVGLRHARALAISFVDVPSALRILGATRQLRPDMPVIVRTMDDRNLEQLKAAGAAEVVPEGLEGSLMMGSHLLMLLGVPVSHVLRQVQTVRRGRYRMLRGFFHGAAGEDEAEESYRVRLHSVALPPRAHAAGKLLSDLGLDGLGVVVTAVRRAGITGPQPSVDTRLVGGDVLVLYGTPEALNEAEKILLEG